MNGSDEQIADALRGIAELARPPRPMVDTAWRAGRRRRLAVMATSAAVIAVTVAAAAALLAGGGQAQHQHQVPVVAPPAPFRDRPPIRFAQVAAISKKPCPPGSHGLPGITVPGRKAASECLHLTGVGMTATGFRSVKLVPDHGGHYIVSVLLKQSDARSFAALTRKLVGLPSPRDDLAIIIGKHVVSYPAVVAPIVGGNFNISFSSRAQAEHFFRILRAD